MLAPLVQESSRLSSLRVTQRSSKENQIDVWPARGLTTVGRRIWSSAEEDQPRFDPLRLCEREISQRERFCAAEMAASAWRSHLDRLSNGPATPPRGAAAFEIKASDGTTLRGQEYGNQEARPVVLIHGWSGSSKYWGLNVSELASKGVRVITYDHRGHGDRHDPHIPVQRLLKPQPSMRMFWVRFRCVRSMDRWLFTGRLTLCSLPSAATSRRMGTTWRVSPRTCGTCSHRGSTCRTSRSSELQCTALCPLCPPSARALPTMPAVHLSSGLGVQGSGSRVQGSGCRVLRRVQGSGFGVHLIVADFRSQGSRGDPELSGAVWESAGRQANLR